MTRQIPRMKAAFNNMNTVQHCSTLFAKSLSFEICHFRGVCTVQMIHSDCCSAPFFDVPHFPAFSQNVTVTELSSPCSQSFLIFILYIALKENQMKERHN